MPLDPGSLDGAGNFVSQDCMARYMDDALPLSGDPEFGKAERRRMLIAIASGVIDYLKAHDGDCFQVTLSPGGSGYSAALEIL